MSGFSHRGLSGTAADLRTRAGRSGWLAAVVLPCAVLTVLLGVLLMHSVPMVHPPGDHSVAGAHTSSALHPATFPGHHAHSAGAEIDGNAVLVGARVVFEMGCSDGCSTHSGMTLCMAMVTAAAALMMLRRLLLANRPGADLAHALARWTGRHASRAPPWATPSLEKLSVLRI
jgi:hypothetical protein